MATRQEVDDQIQQTYTKIWNDWYSSLKEVSPAEVKFDLNCTDSGYNHKRNLIIVSLGEGNLEVLDYPGTNTWPIWKQQLIHEILHEYEMKVICEPSSEGKALHAKYSALHSHPAVWGSMHSESYYTAVCDRATYFGLTPEELLSKI